MRTGLLRIRTSGQCWLTRFIQLASTPNRRCRVPHSCGFSHEWAIAQSDPQFQLPLSPRTEKREPTSSSPTPSSHPILKPACSPPALFPEAAPPVRPCPSAPTTCPSVAGAISKSSPNAAAPFAATTASTNGVSAPTPATFATRSSPATAASAPSATSTPSPPTTLSNEPEAPPASQASVSTA